jgi:S-DNA-T family DNA segregation ATPase FtsK/SpoIIIE
MMAAMTGRWWILALGMLYPAYVLAPALAGRLRSRPPSPDLAAIPSPLAESRAFWGGLTGTIAVAGDEHRARGFARAVVLARGRAPRGGAWSEPWMSWLAGAQSGDAEVVIVGGAEPPSWAETVISVQPSGTTVSARGRSRALPVVSVSRAAAEAWARASAGGSRSAALPSITRLADLDDQDPAARAPSSGPRRLSAPIGVTAVGPLLCDLDAHGPHVLVAGTTGSGKSALLETLVLALADRHAPDDLHIALIDFKGGAGLRACMALPHVAGVLTDLDPHLARRALAALADELAERKRSLAQAGYASFHAWEAAGDAPPRLLVVADEYQELVAHYREFLPDLTRLAAQGRSLGLHLVLATQRPAGAVTPEVRANIGSTIALRVASEAESRDLVGSADAADIPRSSPGRAILAVGGDRTPFQAALPSAEPSPPVSRWSLAPQDADADGLAARVTSRWSGTHATPLWLPPLPERLGEVERPRLAPSDLWLGRGDLPAERAQPELTWDPASGPLVVAGPANSGSTTLLGTLAAQARSCGLEPVWLPSDPREAARTIVLLRGREDWLLLVDDGARALACLAEVDRGARHEDLVNMLAWGKPIALALPLSGPQRLASHASVRVVLAGGDPSDEALWSLPRSLQGLGRMPGRAVVGTGGRWIETQIAALTAPRPRPLVASLPPHLASDDLPAEGVDGLVPIGVGDDDGSVVLLDPRRAVLVVGDSGQARESVATAIGQLGQRVGAGVSARCVENFLLVPRGELEASTVVVATPTCRLVADVCSSDAEGLVDPRPGPGRVVVSVGGTARAVQMATLP